MWKPKEQERKQVNFNDSEFIKKEDAIQVLIDKDYIKMSSQLDIAKAMFDSVPSADVVEVIRCKYCKWAGKDEHCPATEVYMICGDNGYCSCGERKK